MSTYVELKNLTRTMLTLNLPSAVVPELSKFGVVGVTETPVTRTQEGDRVVRGGDKKVIAKRMAIGGSVTLMPKKQKGDAVGGLPLSVLKAHDVETALAAVPPRISARQYAMATEEEVVEVVKEQAKAQAQAELASEHAQVRRSKRDKLAGAMVDETEKK